MFAATSSLHSFQPPLRSIDDEWNRFLQEENNHNGEYFVNNDDNNFDEEEEEEETEEVTRMQSGSNNSNTNAFISRGGVPPQPLIANHVPVPVSTPINFSTKTKMAYLCQPIDLSVFWDIPVMPYTTAANGVVKKQMKVKSDTPEELAAVEQRLARLAQEPFYEELIISQIHSPNGIAKFKDERKITVGVCKTNLARNRTKVKRAFSNCFVLGLRVQFDGAFRDFHIKVFKIGKLKVTGIQSDSMFRAVLDTVRNVLQPYCHMPVQFSPVSDTVIVNSNFKCGYFIRLDTLHDVLLARYNHIIPIYDPCSSYPGIRCKFRLPHGVVAADNGDCDCGDDGVDVVGSSICEDAAASARTQVNSCTKLNAKQKSGTTEVNIMIFRTGSIIISGSCANNVVLYVYNMLTRLFHDEFRLICKKVYDVPAAAAECSSGKPKKSAAAAMFAAAASKTRKWECLMTPEYYAECTATAPSEV